MEETRLGNMEQNRTGTGANLTEWYHGVNLEEAETFIQANLKSAARSVIAIGYYLKVIRDQEYFRDAGYETIWAYAKDRYGFSMSTASRYMARNDRFSKGGNSPVLDDRYQDFSKAQMQEMLSLDVEQLEEVTPEMTVRQIRELKKPAAREIPYYEIPGQISLEELMGQGDEDRPEMERNQTGTAVFQTQMKWEELFGEENGYEDELLCNTCMNASALTGNVNLCAGCTADGRHYKPFPKCVATSQQPEAFSEIAQSPENTDSPAEDQLSAYGTPRKIYPPDSLIACEGCEGGHDCFSCALECQIRGEERYCREAALGNPFPCEIVKAGFAELPDTCQFVNHEKAFHRAGDGEPEPCCKNCQDPCQYICGRAMKALDHQEKEEGKRQDDLELPAAVSEDLSDVELLRNMLVKEKKDLEEFVKVNVEDPDPFLENQIRKKKLLVGALAGMLCDLELEPGTEEMEQDRQQELPLLKNSDQRKKWLSEYQAWGLWYLDEHIDVRYFKYDFDNGARLIVEELTDILPDGKPFTNAFYHLVGGPEPPKHPTYGYGRWTRHETYCHHPDSVTELVEFLKEVQRR